MFVKFETNTTIARKEFKAFIHRIGINSYNYFFKTFASIEKN